VNKHFVAGFADELEKLGTGRNPLLIDAFSDEMEKTAIRETLRIGRKALRAAIKGGTNLKAPPGVYLTERKGAVRYGQDLIGKLQVGGFKVHRARVKSPRAITAKGSSSVPDDLLGMQAYTKSPKDVQKLVNQLRSSGAIVLRPLPITRPGYHGVNIKGTYKGVPFEMQASPGRRSNVGQLMEHSLGYKVSTEAPKANRFDKWFGKKVAPRMVHWGAANRIHKRLGPSWVSANKTKLEMIR
tara:strand:- start:2591 stop:3313 length:723 start_codon:yes stop_codon:yes gene_type:complete